MTISDDTIKAVLTIKTDVKEIPDDVLNLYDELSIKDDIDEDLNRSHILYSFCVILGYELEDKANSLQADLAKWEARRWSQLKSSVKKRYTDNDAKRKVEGSIEYIKRVKKISKYRKLSKQLIYGGGKPLEMKATNLRQKIFRIEKALEGDFNVRSASRDKRVEKAISKKKRRNK